MASWPRVEAMPFAAATLESLRPHHRIALATNAGDSEKSEIVRALRRAGLSCFFDEVYCRRSMGAAKPEPVFFDAVVSDLSLPRHRIIMVGDDFETDVLGANRSGLFAVWLNPRGGPGASGERHAVVRCLSELPALLAGLLPHTEAAP